MKYIKINPEQPDQKSIQTAVDVLHSGGVIIYPTDTLYGLGVDVTNPKALQKLFSLKQRAQNQPVSLLAESIDQIEYYNGQLPLEIYARLGRLLPGKFTVLLQNTLISNFKLAYPLNELKKIGWRVPKHRFARELVKVFGHPISTTSANVSGKGNVKTVAEIISHFGDKPDLIIDAGPIEKNKGSTILDFTKNPPLVIREGDVSLDETKKRLQGIELRRKKEFFDIMFVCSGNICRSPMAEGILKAMISKTRFRHIVRVSSAGTLNLPPSPAHELAEKIADANEINIHKHVSRPINSKLVEQADLIICMAVNHIDYLRKVFPQHKEKFVLLKQWNKPVPLANPSIADPIGHDVDFFSDTFASIHYELKRNLPHLFSRLKEFMAYHDLA